MKHWMPEKAQFCHFKTYRELTDEQVDEVEVLGAGLALGHEDDADGVEATREDVAQELDDWKH